MDRAQNDTTEASREEHDVAGRYEIRIKGHLDTRWADWFEGLSFTHESDGTTILYGPVVDQAALHGLLRKVRDSGLPPQLRHACPNRPGRRAGFQTANRGQHLRKESRWGQLRS